ncbi:hypothetical protein C8029_04125 [Roseobacter sp. TSBP12]|nr:hypothetical protein C8029_04125 [Roseobacter sp. TSBP12]
MKIWDRLTMAVSIFLNGDENEAEQIAASRAAGQMCQRWSEAAAQCPELVADVIRLGGLLEVEPFQYDPETGRSKPRSETRDPYREFEKKGARQFALVLLAAMQINQQEINQLMETSE